VIDSCVPFEKIRKQGSKVIIRIADSANDAICNQAKVLGLGLALGTDTLRSRCLDCWYDISL